MRAETSHSAYLDAVGRDLEAAARRQARVLRRRRARLRATALAATTLVLLAASALAGAGILGERAPGFVQASLGSLWQDDGSSLAPTNGEFRAVAAFDGDTLYRTPGRDGNGVCLSVLASNRNPASRDGIRCFDPGTDSRWPSDVNAVVRGDRQAIFGQIRAPGDASLVLQWPGADAVPIPLSLDGYFLIEVPLLPPRAAGAPVVGALRILGSDGSVIDSRTFFGQSYTTDSDR
jgi:hypothetical protein